MAILTVEGKQFDMDDLSEEAKSSAQSVAFCDNKINQLEAELAVVKMARNGFVQRLVDALPSVEKKLAAKKTSTRKTTATTKRTATKTADKSNPSTTRKRASAATKKSTTTSPTRKKSAAKETFEAGSVVE